MNNTNQLPAEIFKAMDSVITDWEEMYLRMPHEFEQASIEGYIEAAEFLYKHGRRGDIIEKVKSEIV